MDSAHKPSSPETFTPAALLSLQEALASVYWYKSDLRSFLDHALGDRSLLPLLDWKDNKRSIVATLVGLLARDAARYSNDLRRLMVEVARVDDFRHLRRLDDGDEKLCQAQESVAALRRLLRADAWSGAEDEPEARDGERSDPSRGPMGVAQTLARLRADFGRLVASDDGRFRGRRLERLTKGLFAAFDFDGIVLNLDAGRIEGSMTLVDTACLFEARWHDEPADFREILTLGEKIWREPEETLGLFLSLNGFSPNAIRALWDRRPVILMDGGDLMAVLEERIDLVRLLLRKRRHALQTGGTFLPVSRILAGNL